MSDDGIRLLGTSACDKTQISPRLCRRFSELLCGHALQSVPGCSIYFQSFSPTRVEVVLFGLLKPSVWFRSFCESGWRDNHVGMLHYAHRRSRYIPQTQWAVTTVLIAVPASDLFPYQA